MLPLLLLAIQGASAQEGVRVALRVRNRPRRPESGVIALIPDGGLLPGRFVHPAVFDPSGNPLDFQLIWHNPGEGLALVYAPPEGVHEAVVDLMPSARPPPRHESRLRPGLLLYTQNTRPGAASLERAMQLPDTWPPVPEGSMRPINAISHRYNPLGADDHYLTWYAGWFFLDRPETIYFATVSDEGSSLHINGETVAHWPGLHTRHAGGRGEFGNAISLDAGWHRIAYFHFEHTGPQEQLAVWQRGGRNPSRLPVHIPDRAYEQSGSAEITAMRYRDGRGIAWATGWNRPAGYLWIGDEPVNLYRLQAEAGRDAAELRFRWNLEGGRRVEGGSLDWLVRGEARVPVQLETVSAQGVARQQTAMQMWTPPPASDPDRAAVRRDYRRVFLGMLQAIPETADPCADWHPDFWETLDRVLDPFSGTELVLTLFARAQGSLQRLPPALRKRFEIRLAEALRMQPDPGRQIRWLERLAQQARDADQRFFWRQEQVLAYAYDLDDIDSARQQAQRLREHATGVEQTYLALIRLGDVERLAGNVDRAANGYRDALARKPDVQPAARLRDHDMQGRRPGRSLRASPSGIDRTQQWKVQAVQEAAHLATLTAYLEQEAVEDALEALRTWERENPLSKLRGDYPLAAARVYAQVGDYRRAMRTLAAYREAVSMASALPEAMWLEFECLLQLRRFASARELAREMERRFPGHPAVRRVERKLEQFDADTDADGPLINRIEPD